MSDTELRDVPSQEQLAAEQAAAEKSRRGFTGDQNTLSFCRGTEVEAARAAVAKPVDHKTLEGSGPGDSRAILGDVAAASVAKATDNGGPRAGMGQAPLSGKQS